MACRHLAQHATAASGSGIPGPVGLWEGGALIPYDLAEHQGLIADERLRHPPPGSYEAQLRADDKRYERWSREARSGRGEVYLRLGEVDLENVGEVLDFASTFGWLDVRALDVPRMARQWYGVARDKPVPLRVLRHYPGFGDSSRRATPDDSLRVEVVAFVEAQRAAAPVWVIDETLEEFRWGARAIRDLHTAWQCLREGRDPTTEKWANPRMPSAGSDLGQAAWIVGEFLERTIRDALEGFSPRMYLIDVETGRSTLEAVRSPAPPDVTLSV